MITPQQEQIIKRVTQRVQPRMVGIFGSYARGEQLAHSDLDILIDVDNNVNLFHASQVCGAGTMTRWERPGLSAP